MVQQRNIAVCIILSIVTCGLYGIYWFVCLTDDTNVVYGAEGTSGVKALLFTFITCGIYGYYWMYKQGEKLEDAKVRRGIGQPGQSTGIVYLLLAIFGFGIISDALMQDSLNRLAQTSSMQ